MQIQMEHRACNDISTVILSLGEVGILDSICVSPPSVYCIFPLQTSDPPQKCCSKVGFGSEGGGIISGEERVRIQQIGSSIKLYWH